MLLSTQAFAVLKQLWTAPRQVGQLFPEQQLSDLLCYSWAALM